MRLKRKIMMFIHTNKPLITSFYIKKVPIFCRISNESALIRNFLRNGRVRGAELIGRLRVKLKMIRKSLPTALDLNNLQII